MDRYEERNQPRTLSPAKFHDDLVKFFQSLDMGPGMTQPRFQDEPEFKVFFEHNISNFNALVNLKDIYENNYKTIVNDLKARPKLNEEQTSIIFQALNQFKIDYPSEKDQKDIQNGIISEIFWMRIIVYYRIKDEKVSKEFDKPVEIMHEILRKNTILFWGVERYEEALKYIEDQTPEICLAAVRRHGCALQYVKRQTPEICMEAVKRDGYALKYVKEQTEEICIAAVEQDCDSLEFVETQTEEICLAAIHGDNYKEFTFLKYVKPEFKHLFKS